MSETTMNVFVWVVCIGLVCNAWIATVNAKTASRNKKFFEEYLAEKYGPDWRRRFIVPPGGADANG